MRRMRNNNLEIRIAGFFCRIVFNFFWDLQSPPREIDNNVLMQNVGAWWTTKSIMVFFEKGLFK